MVPGTPALVRPAGDVDLATAPELRSVLLTRVGPGDTVLDLAGVPFLDSTGISVLVAAHRAAGEAGHRLVLRGVEGIARRALEALGLHKVLNVEPSS